MPTILLLVPQPPGFLDLPTALLKVTTEPSQAQAT